MKEELSGLSNFSTFFITCPAATVTPTPHQTQTHITAHIHPQDDKSQSRWLPPHRLINNTSTSSMFTAGNCPPTCVHTPKLMWEKLNSPEEPPHSATCSRSGAADFERSSSSSLSWITCCRSCSVVQTSLKSARFKCGRSATTACVMGHEGGG